MPGSVAEVRRCQETGPQHHRKENAADGGEDGVQVGDDATGADGGDDAGADNAGSGSAIGAICDLNFGKGRADHRHRIAQRTRHRLAPPRVKLTAAQIMAFHRRPNPAVRPERVAQHLQLLLDRPMSAPGNPPDHLDPTGQTTTRMTTPFLAAQIRHQHTPVQRAANSAARPSCARRPADRAYGDADDRRLGRDVERFVAEMPVALTRRQALAVELRRVLERENGAGGAKVDGPAKGEEVLHGARHREAERPQIDQAVSTPKLKR